MKGVMMKIVLLISSVVMLFVLMQISGCASGSNTIKPAKKTYHCKVLYDPSYERVTEYPVENIKKLMDRLSNDFMDNFDIKVVLDTVSVFNINNFECSDCTFRQCYLFNSEPDSTDIHIFFLSSKVIKTNDFIGASNPEDGFIVVNKMHNADINLAFYYTYNSLLREMCRIFGALSIQGKFDEIYLMETFLRTEDECYVRTGKDITMKEAIIDRGNRSLIMGISNRSFKRNYWNDTLYQKVKSIYEKQISLCNRSSITFDMRIENMSEDLYSNSSYYVQLAMLAALSGNINEALSLIDKRELYISALINTCEDGTTIGARSKMICADYSKDKNFHSAWSKYFKAIVYLMVGDYNSADRSASEMLVDGKLIDSEEWTKKHKYYELEKAIWMKRNGN